MNILHVNAGNEYGGGLHHIISLIKQMKNTMNVSLLVFEEGPVAQAARRNGITVHVLGQKSKYDVKFITLLKQFINRQDYDIVHSHGPRANTYINRILKSIRPAKWVVTLHSNPELDFKDRGYKGLVFEFIHVKSFIHADFIISVSREIQGIAMKYGMSEQYTSVIPNGIDFREDGRKPVKTDDIFTLLSVGRLEKVKGHHVLLKALSETKITNWELILCGDGSERKNLKTFTENNKIANKVKFAGWVEKEQLDDYYAASDLFVLPSMSESFSLVALEAMEFKLPIVASNVGDMELLFSEKTKDFLIEKNNSVQLRNTIEEAYSLWSEGSLAPLGQTMYESGKQFTIKEQSKKNIEIYQILNK